MESEEKATYIRASTGKLMVVFGRKENPDLIDVFERVLSRFKVEAIKKAFRRAEESLERFPTPKTMAELCAECMPRQTLAYRGCAKCDFTGWRLVGNPDGGNWAIPCECRKV